MDLWHLPIWGYMWVLLAKSRWRKSPKPKWKEGPRCTAVTELCSVTAVYAVDRLKPRSTGYTVPGVDRMGTRSTWFPVSAVDRVNCRLGLFGFFSFFFLLFEDLKGDLGEPF